MKHRVAYFTVLSIAIPLLLRVIELWLAPIAARILHISGITAADTVLLGVSIIAALVCRSYGISPGFTTSNLKLDRRTVLLFFLVLLPTIIRAVVTPVDIRGISFITTAFSEELMCRGVWFSLVRKNVESDKTAVLSYPVLLSSLFFIVWHIPFDLSAPSLFYVIVGIYSSLCLGLLREHSRSLYPGITAHVIKLLV